MRFPLILAALCAPAAASAQCLTIPDGAGNAAVHCPDGTIGHLNSEPSGAVTGMIGAQGLVTTTASLGPSGSALVTPGHISPDLSVRMAPSSPVSSGAAVANPPARPFSTYPDRQSAGMRLQPGEH